MPYTIGDFQRSTNLILLLPPVYFNFKQHQISPSIYLPSWLVPLFLTHLPFEMCARIWDVIILEGDAFIFRAAIAVLGILESRLFFPDRQELLEGQSISLTDFLIRWFENLTTVFTVFLLQYFEARTKLLWKLPDGRALLST